MSVNLHLNSIFFGSMVLRKFILYKNILKLFPLL
jgi:hypothetical protein